MDVTSCLVINWQHYSQALIKLLGIWYAPYMSAYGIQPICITVCCIQSLARCVCMCVWSEWKAPLLSNSTTLTGASERLGVIYSRALPLSQTDNSPMRPLWVLHHAPVLKCGQQHSLFICLYCLVPQIQYLFSKVINITRSVVTM